MGVCLRHRSCWPPALALVVLSASQAFGGLVNVELRPSTQTVPIGATVEVGVYAVSANGAAQDVGFIGAVLVWDAGSLTLMGHTDVGAFAWSSSGFPSEAAGVNNTFLDGDAFYQATTAPGGPYASATAAGTLMTTLRFTALASSTGSTLVRMVPCVGATCTNVLDKHPFDIGVVSVMGSIGPPVEVIVSCQTQAQCDDTNPCTDDICTIAGVCSHTPNAATNPSDGLFCNGLEVCIAGQVVIDPGSIPNCDDGLICTNDACNEVSNGCDHLVVPEFCLIGGLCRANGDLNPVNECEACSVVDDPVAWTRRAIGEACGDLTNTACDGPDTCDGFGACGRNIRPSGTPCGSSDSTTCSAADSCDGAGVCLGNDAPDGTACDDGLFCTTTQSCQGGQCVGGGAACPGQVCDDSVDKCKAVNLEFRPAQQGPIVIGDFVVVGFYAVSDTGVDQAISAVSAVLDWDPTLLELVGVVNNGPVPWLLSAFPNDSGLDGLNNTFLDGDALYKASATPNPNPPALATLTGLLVTSFQFRAIAPGAASLRIVPVRGGFSKTQVIDGETVALDITGLIGPPGGFTIVECLIHADCNDGAFCTGVETCAGNVCVAGTPPNCDDGVFCNGVETCQPGVGCVSAGNPCPDPVSCDEISATCGGCAAPSVETVGSRYFGVTPAMGSDLVALRVTGNATDIDVSCLMLYVQDDGGLGATPRFQTPAAWGTVFVHGLQVRPNTQYSVQADCRPGGVGFVSARSAVRTWVWGDVNGDGAAAIEDVIAVSDASMGLIAPGLSLQGLDLSPCLPDGIIDAQDLASVQSAFSNGTFDCTSPCNACVASAAPQPPADFVPTNRYLSFVGGNPGRQTAVRVTLTSLPAPYDIWNGLTMWVASPAPVSELPGQGFNDPPGTGATFQAASLQCAPLFADWSQFGTVYVHHAVIVPSRLVVGGGAIEVASVYSIQELDSRCDIGAEAAYSTSMTTTMSAWGDVSGPFENGAFTPPDARVDVTTDVIAMLATFSRSPGAPIKFRSDLEPAEPNAKINISDILASLDGFRGLAFPHLPGATPCP